MSYRFSARLRHGSIALLLIIGAAYTSKPAIAQADTPNNPVGAILSQDTKGGKAKVIVLPPVKMNFLNSNNQSMSTGNFGSSNIGIAPIVIPPPHPKPITKKAAPAAKVAATHQSIGGYIPPTGPISAIPLLAPGNVAQAQLPIAPNVACLNEGASGLTAACLKSLGIPMNEQSGVDLPSSPNEQSVYNPGSGYTPQPQPMINSRVTCVVTLSNNQSASFYTKTVKSCIEAGLVISKPVTGNFTIMLVDEAGNTSGILCNQDKNHKDSCSVMKNSN
jgi:hypothetical protein